MIFGKKWHRFFVTVGRPTPVKARLCRGPSDQEVAPRQRQFSLPLKLGDHRCNCETVEFMHTSAFPLLRKKKKTPNKITIFYDFQHLHGSLPTARRGRVCHLARAISGGGELSVVQSARHTSHSLLTRTSDRGVKSGGGEAEDN